ncbi:6825_t:CDS:2 [Ambispora leptoticha]|uniref:6825_t:CDS:1 n=1 Tax=Ambispora leptoticha TaxID=144679 RepID=A0A9N8VA43_9GLOM|nr:6825_t:CDS:2 [Ambispora leptoticha]
MNSISHNSYNFYNHYSSVETTTTTNISLILVEFNLSFHLHNLPTPFILYLKEVYPSLKKSLAHHYQCNDNNIEPYQINEIASRKWEYESVEIRQFFEYLSEVAKLIYNDMWKISLKFNKNKYHFVSDSNKNDDYFQNPHHHDNTFIDLTSKEKGHLETVFRVDETPMENKPLQSEHSLKARNRISKPSFIHSPGCPLARQQQQHNQKLILPRIKSVFGDTNNKHHQSSSVQGAKNFPSRLSAFRTFEKKQLLPSTSKILSSRTINKVQKYAKISRVPVKIIFHS